MLTSAREQALPAIGNRSDGAPAQAPTAWTPAVSIVLPTYNRLPLLRSAVQSVSAQTFGDWELIVVDDGSTDETREYLEAIDDVRVRPVWLEHRGDLTSARSAGVRHACGEWVAFLDSDDLWLPDKLASQLRWLAAHPTCRWSYTGYSLIDADGRPLPERSRLFRRPVSGYMLELMLSSGITPAIPTILVQRALVEEIGGFDETLPIRSDFDFTLRLAARSEACGVRENLAFIREHAGRTTAHLRAVDLYIDQERIFRKAAAAAINRRMRALCSRQRATQLAKQASARSREGSHGAAFAALVRAACIRPVHRMLWRIAAGCAARAIGWR